MRKWLILILLLGLTVNVTANSIGSESITVDLETGEVEGEIEVDELTGSVFTYITSYPVEDVEGSINGENIECQVSPRQIGSRIACDTQKSEEFTVNLNFKGSGFTSTENGLMIFRYTQQIYRPTEEYRLRVLLPEGAGLSEESDINPENYETGSTGTRIWIEWAQNPGLGGEPLNFEAGFEDFGGQLSVFQIMAILFLFLIALVTGWIGFKGLNKESIDQYYKGLEEDQASLLDRLRESDGEMLQRDIVEESDYSKAKVSSLISDLEEKELVEKEKEGRSNRVSIPKQYKI